MNNNEINEIIDSVSEKFGYDEELNFTLKRIVPFMLDGKSDELKNMLFDTLNRVKIFVLPNGATQEDVDKCQEEVFKKQEVSFVQADTGEYGKTQAAAAYINEPIFDKDMNIVDRQSFLYVTKLSKYDSLCKVYDTEIDLSHLIHELGHAWASEKDEFVQDEQGNYETNVGACTIKTVIDRENKTAKDISMDNIFREEALNTIEEENVLCKVLNIEDISVLKEKGYVPSNYQWFMADMMREYVEKFGSEAFDKYRFEKDKGALEDIEKALENTNSMSVMNIDSYTEKKKRKFERIHELKTTEGAKKSIIDIIGKYTDVYFPNNSKFTPLEKLENVFTQIYNMKDVKYNFDFLGNADEAKSEFNREIYNTVISAIIAEGYVPVREAEIVKAEKNKEENSFLSELEGSVKTAEEMADDKNVVGSESKKIENKEVVQEKQYE